MEYKIEATADVEGRTEEEGKWLLLGILRAKLECLSGRPRIKDIKVTPVGKDGPRESQHYKLYLVCEVEGTTTHEQAERKLDAFREAVMPASEYGITLYQQDKE